MKTPNIEPRFITAGEKIEWKLNVEKYSSKDGWDLFYSFRNSKSKFDVAAIPKDDHYLVCLSSAETSKYQAGNYWWQLTAPKDDDWHIIAKGEMVVSPNLSLVDSYDGRSHIKQVLDSLEAMLVGKASRDQMSYSISGRSLSRLSPAELLKWREVYKAEYARELQQARINEGLGSGSIIKVRFNNP